MGLLRFNMALEAAGVDPRDVRLLRHETYYEGRTPFGLWRDDLDGFEKYQRVQKASRRGYFRGSFWASFVVTPEKQTLFVGLYRVHHAGTVPKDWIDPIDARPHDWSLFDLYDTQIEGALSEYIGRLVVDWGASTRSWIQRADKQNKSISQLFDQFSESPFPGYSEFYIQLSDLPSVPSVWRGILSSSRGVYLLTCPRTKEQYVGSAFGEDGFWGRWQEYVSNNHGGNVGLRIREPSDYRVSILQVAGSLDSHDEVLKMEAAWKAKLQSREMGLNKN